MVFQQLPFAFGICGVRVIFFSFIHKEALRSIGVNLLREVFYDGLKAVYYFRHVVVV